VLLKQDQIASPSAKTKREAEEPQRLHLTKAGLRSQQQSTRAPSSHPACLTLLNIFLYSEVLLHKSLTSARAARTPQEASSQAPPVFKSQGLAIPLV